MKAADEEVVEWGPPRGEKCVVGVGYFAVLLVLFLAAMAAAYRGARPQSLGTSTRFPVFTHSPPYKVVA